MRAVPSLQPWDMAPHTHMLCTVITTMITIIIVIMIIVLWFYGADCVLLVYTDGLVFYLC